MPRATLTLSVLIGLAAHGFAGEAIPAKTLNELKRATVFLRVNAGTASGSGSGFLIQADGETGYIITNRHVVVPPVLTGGLLRPTTTKGVSVQAVFNSGNKDEVSYPAEIVAAVADADLAILRVKNAKELPAPLSLLATSELSETMPVFCVGFPFGKLLSIGNTNPAITIGKGSVSSLRNNKQGELVAIQIDGAINPGNSGGPVVDPKGRIVGVAVATVPGAQIGLAIPAAEVTKLLGGRVMDAKYQVVKGATGEPEVRVDVTLADPFNKVRSVAVQYIVADNLKEKPVKGERKPLNDASKSDLAVKDQTATASLRLPNDGKTYWMQITFAGGDGKAQYLEPTSVRIDPAGQTAVIGNVQDAKGKAMSVNFTVGDVEVRAQAAERIKQLVGNKLTRWQTSSVGTRTTVLVSPVDDPQAFTDRLKELGQITKIEGDSIHLTLSDMVIAKLTKPPPMLIPGDAIGKALAELASADYFTRKKAAELLSRTPPNEEKREQVLTSLKNYLSDSNIFIRRLVVETFASWTNKERAAELFPVLSDSDFMIRKNVIAAVSKFPSEGAATALAKKLTDIRDRREVSQALIGMGATAEKAVIEMLGGTDVFARSEACKILQHIGTMLSIGALQDLARDERGTVRNAANEAIRAINGREKK